MCIRDRLTPAALRALNGCDGGLVSLRTLHLVHDHRGRTIGADPPLKLNAACARTLAALGSTVRALHLQSCTTLVDRDIPLLAAALPRLEVCDLASALTMSEAFWSEWAHDYESAPGHHDADLLALCRACPLLRVLDLSSCDDACYAYFSERGLCAAVRAAPRLRDLFVYENGRKFDFRVLHRSGVAPRLRVHTDAGWRFYMG